MFRLYFVCCQDPVGRVEGLYELLVCLLACYTVISISYLESLMIVSVVFLLKWDIGGVKRVRS